MRPDIVASSGRNLDGYVDAEKNPTAGLRMEIPKFLTGTFKLLQHYAYNIKRDQGPTTRKLVKFDEDTSSLYLDVKLPAAAHVEKRRVEHGIEVKERSRTASKRGGGCSYFLQSSTERIQVQKRAL